jgi:prespore-specific regulator
MGAIRQDAWTTSDDLTLAEITLRHIREGGTQLSAFAEVGQKIGRTQAACGFRWNSFLRKQYEGAIQQAKVQRQRSQSERRKFSLKRKIVEPVEMSDLPPLLDAIQQWASKIKHLEHELRANMQLVTALKKENEDYRALLQIIERARHQSVQMQIVP